jgi:hypothetical protein
MSDIGVVFPPSVVAWLLLGESVPYTTAAMAGLVAAVLLSRRSGHARLRRWLILPLVIVAAAWLAGLSVWAAYLADWVTTKIYVARHHYRLDAATMFAGIEVPKGSRVWLDEAWRLYQIDTDAKMAVSIDGARWRDEIRLIESNTGTAPGRGILKSATLAEDSLVQGIPCRGGSLVEFSDDGRDLQHCRLTQRTTVAAEITDTKGEKTTVELGCAAANDIWFGVWGRRLVERCLLSAEAWVGSIVCAGGQEIVFDGDGLAACILAAAQRVGQFDLAAKTPVGFIQGQLDRFEMPPESPPLTVSGIAIPPGTAVQLCYRAQQLDRLFVPERRYVVVGGIRLTGNVNFDCGRFQFGSLFEATVVRGRPLPRGAAILHDDVLSAPT